MPGSKELIGLLAPLVLVLVPGAGAEVDPLVAPVLVAVFAAGLPADDAADHFGGYLHIHPLHRHDPGDSLVTRHVVVVGAVVGVGPIGVIRYQVVAAGLLLIGGVVELVACLVSVRLVGRKILPGI